MALVNINGVLVNPAVAKMYGIPYHKLTKQQKKVLHADSVRRAKENAAREKAVLKNNLKAFTDEKKMESVLAQIYQGCQKQILADVAKTMAEVQKAGGTWSYANQSALTRSKGLFYQIEEELKKLGVAQTNTMYSGLGNIYTDQFLRTTFELGQTLPMPATVNFTKLNPALVRRTLDYPWSGELFSDRIWADKAKLGRSLRVNLTASMVLGEDMRRISERINKNVQESENAAMRLARTETKRVVYVAHDDVYEEFGVDELEYRCANGIDNRTCKVCKQFNGTVYKRGQEIPLPVHPNCRCVYIPVIADTFKPGELNELTHDTRGAENYEKWEAKQRKEAEKAAKANPNTESAKVLQDLQTKRKSKQAELEAARARSSQIADELDKGNIVRRGLQTPEEGGFGSKKEFDAWNKALADDLDAAQAQCGKLNRELYDIDLDIKFISREGITPHELECYQTIRTAAAENTSFTYLRWRDELYDMCTKMDADALEVHRGLATIIKDNAYGSLDGSNSAHYSPWKKKVFMQMSNNTHEKALGKKYLGSWQTKYHEEGHQLDHLLSTVKEFGNGATDRAFTNMATDIGKEFSEAIEKDLLSFVNAGISWYNKENATKAGFKAIKKLTNFNRIPREARYAFDGYYCSLTSSGADRQTSCKMGMLVDALGLHTKDRLSRNTLSCSGWGHDSSYNRDRDGNGATSETWATFCALRTCGDLDEVDFIKKLMPNTWKAMDKVFVKIAKYLKTHTLSY